MGLRFLGSFFPPPDIPAVPDELQIPLGGRRDALGGGTERFGTLQSRVLLPPPRTPAALSGSDEPKGARQPPRSHPREGSPGGFGVCGGSGAVPAPTARWDAAADAARADLHGRNHGNGSAGGCGGCGENRGGIGESRGRSGGAGGQRGCSAAIAPRAASGLTPHLDLHTSGFSQLWVLPPSLFPPIRAHPTPGFPTAPASPGSGFLPDPPFPRPGLTPHPAPPQTLPLPPLRFPPALAPPAGLPHPAALAPGLCSLSRGFRGCSPPGGVRGEPPGGP